MIGEWIIISGNEILAPNTINPLVTNLEEGENIFQWTLINNCGSSVIMWL